MTIIHQDDKLRSVCTLFDVGSRLTDTLIIKSDSCPGEAVDVAFAAAASVGIPAIRLPRDEP